MMDSAALSASAAFGIDPGLAPVATTPKPRSRVALLKRLTDVVCLPGSRVNAFERAIVSDLLVELLADAGPQDRGRIARRLSSLTEAGGVLVRLLLRDEIEIARPMLEAPILLGEADLLDAVRAGGAEHRRLIALRKGLGELICDALVEHGEMSSVETLLRNESAKFSTHTLETLVTASRDTPRYVPLLLKRRELQPRHAYALFWWADSATRIFILQRFAVSREVMQDAVGDIFPMAAEEGWNDDLSRKALQFIERRQRNRAAIAKSPFGSLEEAVAAAQAGLTRELVDEVSYLSGVRPNTGAKIFSDPGGEPIAILCKSTGLPRAAVRALWRGQRRPETDSSGAPHPALERVMQVFDMLAVDRAQTVLRYWNWVLAAPAQPAALGEAEIVAARAESLSSEESARPGIGAL